MKNRLTVKQAAVLALSGLIFFSAFALPACAEPVLLPATAEYEAAQDYFSYYNTHKTKNKPADSIKISTEELHRSQFDSSEKMLDDTPGVVLDNNNQWSEWTFEVPAAGVYNLNVEYYPLPGSGKDIEFSLQMDDALPFSEANILSLPRLWSYQRDEKGNAIQKDAKNNEIRPQQQEISKWTSAWLTDSMGLYDEPYLFYLETGTHTLRLTLRREAFAVAAFTLAQKSAPPTYEEYLRLCGGKAVKGVTYKLEGEDLFFKNSPMPAPGYDSANAAMSPQNDPARICLTTIDADTWSQNGQMLAWQVPDTVEEGLYHLQLRVLQRANPGVSTYRCLTINGEVPFAQAKNIAFPYSSKWYIKTLGDDTPYYVYVKPGDVLGLVAVTGDAAEVLREINQAVFDLNAVYRQIINVTGTKPDPYRDYLIEQEIPSLIADLEGLHTRTEAISAMLKELTGKTNSQTAILDQLTLLIRDFIRQPAIIPANLYSFKGSIDGAASIILSYNEQPLSLDFIGLYADDMPAPQADSGFFTSLVFGLKRLLFSFAGDYDSIAAAGYEKNISVWAIAGRDQAQIISQLVNEQFCEKEKIGVVLSLVPSEETLIQNLLADRGPDATLLLTNEETPVNLALRGAAVDLANGAYPLTDELKNQFHFSVWPALSYKGGVYGLPEQSDFYMMFYRSDILRELGIKIPDTWDEFFDVVKILHNKNYAMGIQEIGTADTGLSADPGISASIPIFNSFLFQNNGMYFNENTDKTAFDTPVAYEAFDKWVALYRDYGFERSFEFSNLMRMGEMPIGIAPYNRTYVKLMATAPELRGLWSFAPIPGVKREGGTIDRSTSTEVGACVMHHNALRRGVDQEAFRFLAWWTGKEAQTAYAQGMETTLGISGRAALANLDAWSNLGWSVEESSLIEAQREWVKGIPQVPGSYILKRSLSNALRRAVTDREESRRMLSVNNRIINEELTRKRKEFEG